MFQIPFIPSAAIAAVFISVCYSFSLSFSLSLFVSLSHAIPLQLSTCVSYSNHSYNCNTSPISPLLYICLPFSLSFTRSFTLLLQLSTYVSYSTHSHMSRVNSLSTLVCLKSSRNISTSSVTPPTRLRNPPPAHALSSGIQLEMEVVYFHTIYAQFIEPTSMYKQGPNNN